MDLTFRTEMGRFNYRVCAVILRQEYILAMKDERSPYYYLPGGRVHLHETAEDALRREIKEELLIDAEIVRPLWFNQSFFTEDVDQERYHEICVYFLVNIEHTGLRNTGSCFRLDEGKHTHVFEWLPYDSLKSLYFYPEFLKERIRCLPESLEMLTTIE